MKVRLDADKVTCVTNLMYLFRSISTGKGHMGRLHIFGHKKALKKVTHKRLLWKLKQRRIRVLTMFEILPDKKKRESC